MSRILMLEDDRALGTNLKLYLETQGYQVEWVQDVKSAKKKVASEKFDLWLLDWSLPDGTGFEFLKSFGDAPPAPAFFLTAREDEESAIQGLSIGAADYIRKPFGQGELTVKIKKVLGQAHQLHKKIRFHEIALDLDSRQAFYGKREITLRRKEFDVLELLVKRSDSVVTREDLMQKLGDDGEMFDRTIDSHVSRIRKSLKDAGVEDIELASVYGVGYQLKKRGG